MLSKMCDDRKVAAWGATKSMNGPKTCKNVLNFVYNNRKAIKITK